jgi:transcriptional regulator with XRE-family HTH domain
MNLQQLLDFLGVSQSELARKIDCSPQAISRVCSGAREPSLALLRDISRALDVRIEISADGFDTLVNSFAGGAV